MRSRSRRSHVPSSHHIIAYTITLLLLALYHFAAAVLYRYVVPTMDEM